MSGKSSSQKRAEQSGQEQLARLMIEQDRLKRENEAMMRTSGEQGAAMLRARRGSRALLSDARLNPEQGVATLGASPEV